MANSAAKPKFSLRLLIDEEKNRVVLAEAEKDFVDVLCSLLTLPMGTIVRLLEKHQNPQSSIVGCFHNLYKSVSGMDVDNFKTQACKNFLQYPRSAKANHCRKLKLNLNIDDTEATKFFVCPKYISTEACCKVYSNVRTSRCRCRAQLLDVDVQEIPEYECLVNRSTYGSSVLSKKIQKNVLAQGKRIAKLISMDSKVKVTSDSTSMGLVKGETNFIVSDDLVVTPMKSSSTISLLSKLQMSISDIEEQVISFGKSEATSLLRASLITTSALTNGLSNFLSKMQPTEATPSTS